MKYLLDSNIISFYQKSKVNPRLVDRVHSLELEDIAASIITYIEVMSWVMIVSGVSSKSFRTANRFFI